MPRLTWEFCILTEINRKKVSCSLREITTIISTLKTTADFLVGGEKCSHHDSMHWLQDDVIGIFEKMRRVVFQIQFSILCDAPAQNWFRNCITRFANVFEMRKFFRWLNCFTSGSTRNQACFCISTTDRGTIAKKIIKTWNSIFFHSDSVFRKHKHWKSNCVSPKTIFNRHIVVWFITVLHVCRLSHQTINCNLDASSMARLEFVNCLGCCTRFAIESKCHLG